MILFLDDDLYRCKRFLSRTPSASIVTTARDAIFALVEIPAWDIVYLDHDLGGEEHVDGSRPDTGMEVVRWIVKHKPTIGKVIIHSLNYPAAIAMHDALESAGYQCDRVPFTAMFSPSAIPPAELRHTDGSGADV